MVVRRSGPRRPPSPAQTPWRPGPAHRHPAPRHPLLPPAGQASITAPERPPSRLLRAPPLSSLGLPHLHSPGSPLLDKVTSAHSGARGFHRGGSHRRPPGQGGAKGREPGRPGGGPVRELQNPGRLAGPGTARKAWWRRGGEGLGWDLNARPQVPSGAGVGLGGQNQNIEAAAQKRNPYLETGAPRHPVSLRPTTGEGPAVRGSRPGVPSPLEGCPAHVPAPVTRRAASPPPHPVWYLHLSHICKLLSCPRLVTAEPSATDLAPLIFPPKSILYFPLIIPWLLSELSLLPRLLQANACLSATAPPPTQNRGPKGMVNIWGGGLDFQHCQPPTWGAKARKCTHPLRLLENTQHSEPSPPSGSLSSSCLPTSIHLGWFQDPKPAP